MKNLAKLIGNRGSLSFLHIAILLAVMTCLQSCGDRSSEKSLSEQPQAEEQAPGDGPNLAEKELPEQEMAKILGENKFSNAQQIGLVQRPPLEEVTPSVDPPAFSAIVQAARKSFAEELVPVLGDKRAENKLFRAKWQSNVSKLPAKALESAADPLIAEGDALPSEAVQAIGKPDALLEEILKGEHASFRTDKDGLEAIATIQLLAIGMGDDLPSALIGMADRLPPTEADVQILAASLLSISHRGPVMDSSKGWERLINAKNPIYRFLALRAARQGDWTGSPTGARYTFAQRFADETDISLIKERIRLLGTIPLPDARADLEALQLEFAGTETEQIATEALRTLDLLAQTQR